MLENTGAGTGSSYVFLRMVQHTITFWRLINEDGNLAICIMPREIFLFHIRCGYYHWSIVISEVQVHRKTDLKWYWTLYYRLGKVNQIECSWGRSGLIINARIMRFMHCSCRGHVPTFYGSVTVHSSGSSNEYADVQGILIEYIDRFCLRELSIFCPKDQWQSVGEDAIHIVHCLNFTGIEMSSCGIFLFVRIRKKNGENRAIFPWRESCGIGFVGQVEAALCLSSVWILEKAGRGIRPRMIMLILPVWHFELTI